MTKTNPIIVKAIDILNARKDRSKWNKAVTDFAYDLLMDIDEAIRDGYFDAENLKTPKLLTQAMLNGAQDWRQYAWGGCGLVYDGDIAEALCTPSELKRTRNGERRPNSCEKWLDVYARAMWQACARANAAIRGAINE